MRWHHLSLWPLFCGPYYYQTMVYWSGVCFTNNNNGMSDVYSMFQIDLHRREIFPSIAKTLTMMVVVHHVFISGIVQWVLQPVPVGYNSTNDLDRRNIWTHWGCVTTKTDPELIGRCLLLSTVPNWNGTWQFLINGHDSGTDWLEVPTIYKAYVSIKGLCKGISPQNMALYGAVPP